MRPVPPAKSTFSLSAQPEVFFTSTATSRPIRRLLAGGKIRQIQGPLYTKNLEDPLENVTRRRGWDIAAGFFPGSVIADRTAFEMKPVGDEGAIFLSGKTTRTIRLPGLVLSCRRGAGPVEGDNPFLNGGLYLSSYARRFLDNMRPSRARRTTRRTLTRSEVEDKLREVLLRQGVVGLNRIRDEAAAIAEPLEASAELEQLNDLIGALLGTVDAPLSPAGRAAAAGRGWDDKRLALFDALASALVAHIPTNRPDRPGHTGQAFAFYESYFSNFIEGTEFSLEEAREIVFDGVIPEQRPADGRDIAGTFDLVVDPVSRAQVPSNYKELNLLIRGFHERIMAGRPGVGPGDFKKKANRAGNTEFVDPTLVEGTLERGWDRYYTALEPGFSRAVFALFLIAEIHPFADGNGRVARALANAELTASGQQRLIVPTIFRDDYLQALRALSRHSRPEPLVRVADRAQAWTYEVDWSTLEAARADLEATNALMLSQDAYADGVILKLPSELAVRR